MTEPDFEKTMLMPRRSVGSALPPGTQLDEFVVDGTIGIGGFSIVYKARDTRLDRPVAIKEYIPATLARRGAGGVVEPRSPNQREHYDLGLQGFINEARMLATFDHPALVKVWRFWADNGTAYMAMPLYQGLTLKAWLASLGTPPSEAWLRVLATQLTEALEALHGEACYHRDVAPDNILLLHDKGGSASFLEQRPRPLLLDFGAARRVISDATQNLTAIVKPGYAPVEQYADDTALKQGPWTDVYALCALLYAAIAGKPPPSAIGRTITDHLVPPRQLPGAAAYGAPFLDAIGAGLALWPKDRPQSMAALRALFDAPPVATRQPPAPAWWQRLLQRWQR